MPPESPARSPQEQPPGSTSLAPAPDPIAPQPGWDHASAHFHLDRCVHQLFEEQVRRSPDAIAVEAGFERVAYGKLNARANRLAHYLCSLHVSPDTLVALCTSRSIDMVVGMLAIHKAGAAFLPLDPAQPPARLAFMLSDAGARLIVTQSQLLDRLPARDLHTICLDGGLPADLPETNPDLPVQPSHLAYAIFTSGSTGLPKAAAVEHLSLSNLVQSHWLIFSDTAQDRFSQFANLAFDAVLFEVWPCLTQGATLRIVDEAVRSSAVAFRDWLVEHAITFAFAPTPLAEEMLELNWPRETALRCFSLGGSKMHRAPRQTLPFTVHNVYGPTETSVWTTQHQVESSDQKDGAPPIGGPIPNVRAYILNAQQSPVEPGTTGELYLGGVCVGRGYLNRPELTAERFLPDPFAENTDTRIFRTGDLVRWRDDGTLDFIGPVDDQLNPRGFRIEPAEIEAALSSHPAVSELLAQTAEGAASPVTPAPRDAPLPLSYSQESLWLQQRSDPGNRAYQAQAMLGLQGNLNLTALEQALTALVQRHEILRTTFPESSQGPVQSIHPPFPVRLQVEDLSALPEPERDAAAKDIVRALCQEPFDLDRLPLIRWRLLRMTPEDHRLIQVEHHLIHDGWSYNLLLRELVELYRAFDTGTPSGLSQPSLQFADFASWQRRYIESGVGEQQIDFWRRTLAGCPAELDLPFDRPRPSRQTYRGAAPAIELPGKLMKDLAALSRQEGVTLFDTMLAAFAALLHRLTWQNDFCIGSGVANRRWKPVEEIAGMIVNNVVLRMRFTGDDSFRDVLRKAHHQKTEAYAHQDAPFEQVVRALNPERDPSRHPVFQVVFSFHDSPLGNLHLPGLVFQEPRVLSNGSAKFDLNVVVIPRHDGRENSEFTSATLLWEYNSDLFDPETIDRILSAYRLFLEAVLLDPSQPVAGLPLLNEAQRKQVVLDWNNTATPYPRDAAIHQLFEEQAAARPKALALSCGQEQLNYGELNARANQLARHLQDLGAGPEAVVALCLERSLDLVVALLAILKAGGAYLPLDPGYPPQRLDFMLRDAGASLLLTHSRVLDRLPTSHPAHVLCLDTAQREIAQHSPSNLAQPASAEDLAYIIYTSGSTGLPKGTSVCHRSVVRLVRDTNYVSLGPDDVLLQFAPVSFDASTFEIWGSLLNGARLAVFPPHTPALEELGDFIREQKITTLWLTAALFHQMADHQADSLATVRQLLAGGDVLSVPHVKKMLSLLRPGQILVNGYGPTENTTFTCCHVMDASSEIGSAVPIGRPISNTRVYVLDRYLQPVPPGLPGELYTGGDGLARGYLNRQELTAERFLTDPFAVNTDARMYRTGDLVRRRNDGPLDFIGRVDDQVKIRGFRIELGEIEAVLRTHPAVQEAAVAAWSAGAGLRLAAYVASKDSRLTNAELTQHLRSSLPDYMIPSTFEFLESLPKTSSGKLNRRALPEPSGRRPQLETPYTAPCTPLEQFVASTWETALGLDSVGIHDHFISLGGSSLLATHILAQLREHGGWDLPPGAMFERPTVALLSELLAETAEGPASPITPAPRDAPLPLSYSQERVWLLERWDPGNRAYQVQAMLGLQGNLNLTALEQALTALVQRHEILRTTFPDSSQGPVQSIHPPFPVRLQVEDLSALPEPERDDAAKDIVHALCQEPFDVDRLPLIRWKLLRMTPEDHRLIQVEHHLIHDGWSFNLLLREVVELYRAFDTGTPSGLAQPSLQFADFARWQRRYIESGVGEQQVEFWRKALAGCPAELDLPFDRPRPSRQTYRGAAPTIELPGKLMQNLAALSRQEGVTLFDTMLAAFAALLHRLTWQDDFCIGSGVANRRWKPVEEIAGMIVNNVVLRMRFTGDDSFRDVLRRAQHQKAEAYAHQDAPFEQVVRALNPERDPSRHPVFQVMFSFHDSPLGNLHLPGLVFQEPRVLSNGSSKFDLNVVVIPRHGGRENAEFTSATLLWEYNSDLFDPETIDRMLSAYRLFLEAVLLDPSQPVAGLPLLSEAQRKQVVLDWNNTATPYPRDAAIHQLFEEQAAARPEALALSCGQEQLNYGELNARANQLARHLQELGAGPETVVALCLERSLDLVVALLAILKAGGAYLPLDPGYPPQRLDFMLRDAGASLLLTHSRFLDRLPTSHPAHVLCLDTAQRELAQHSPSNLAQPASAEDLAYIIYTSGSTGLPKGTSICHRSVVRLVRNTNYIDLGPSDVLLQFSTVSFDASTFEVWGSLLNGAQLVVFPPQMPGLNELGDFLRTHKITTLFLTTALFHQMVDHQLSSLTTVRRLLAGGEVMSASHLRKLLAALPPGHEFIHCYGPTENTTFTTCWIMDGSSQTGDVVPIGRPISNTRVYVLDRGLQPLPPGLPGELYLGGDGLARAYINQPELTAQRFLPDPFADTPEARLYRTGDRCRWRPDGLLEFVGRRDHQIKLRGFRVELGEIEAVLLQHPAVRDAIAILRRDTPQSPSLTAYVTPREPGGDRPVETLAGHLRESLPHYMIPAALVWLDKLPVNANGKIDREALPPPSTSSTAAPSPAAEPQTETERQVAAIWADLLGRSDAGMTGNFFQLGGHSLLGMQLIARAGSRYNLRLPISILFENPTIRELAAAIDAALSVRRTSPAATSTLAGTGEREEGEL